MTRKALSLLLSLLLLLAPAACSQPTQAMGVPDRPAEEPADLADPVDLAVPEESTVPVDPAVIEDPTDPVDPAVTEDLPVPEEDPADNTVELPEARVVDPERPMVALTYDDGPHAAYTAQLLDILEEHGAAATFFMLGRSLQNAPETVLRAQALGCEIGNHSYRHANLGRMSAASIAADLAAADQAFIDVLGYAPTLLRPPYGSMNRAVKTTTGRSIITWSVDTQDWLSRDAGKVVASVQGAGNLDGQVILLHDIYASTVEASRTLIPWLIEQGYQLVTVTELITLHYGDELLPNGLYGYSYFLYNKPVILPAA